MGARAARLRRKAVNNIVCALLLFAGAVWGFNKLVVWFILQTGVVKQQVSTKQDASLVLRAPFLTAVLGVPYRIDH